MNLQVTIIVKTKKSDYNGFGGGYAGEQQCDIARGFNPWSVLIFILRPEGARDEKYFQD